MPNPLSQLPKACRAHTHPSLPRTLNLDYDANVGHLQRGVWWRHRASDVLSVGQQRVLVKILWALYESAGTLNSGPGIYNRSLAGRRKAPVFINVNVRDLYLNVIFTSQLKGVLMRKGQRGE